MKIIEITKDNERQELARIDSVLTVPRIGETVRYPGVGSFKVFNVVWDIITENNMGDNIQRVEPYVYVVDRV